MWWKLWTLSPSPKKTATGSRDWWRRPHAFTHSAVEQAVCVLCARVRADEAHAVLTMVPKPGMGVDGYASVSERLLPRITMRTYGPGWYTAYPRKHHKGGRCIYCLAIFHYSVAIRYDRLPETNDHEMRRCSDEEEVIFGLERREPDFDRKYAANGDYDDHDVWRGALIQQTKKRQRLGLRTYTQQTKKHQQLGLSTRYPKGNS